MVTIRTREVIFSIGEDSLGPLIRIYTTGDRFQNGISGGNRVVDVASLQNRVDNDVEFVVFRVSSLPSKS